MNVKVIHKRIRRSLAYNEGNILRLFWNMCASYGLTNFIPDKVFLKINYRMKIGKRLNLQKPTSFNEKIQWLKLYDRNPRYTSMVDKYEVKKYVTDIIGEQYIIPTLGVYDHFEDIDFEALPDSFVVKCTHDSGGLVIVRDKKKLKIEEAQHKIEKCLKYNYYLAGREWAYKNVKPRIIIEKYMEDNSGENGDDGLFDYKIFSFDGEPKIIQVDFNRFIDHKRNLYDIDWNYLNVTIEYPTNPEYIIKRPAVLDEMLLLASKLSKGIPFVRVDFYCIHNQIYFGELTLYHGSGIEMFEPKSFGDKMGSYIKLPKYKRYS